MSRHKKQPQGHPELGLPEVRSLWKTVELFSEHYLKSRIQQNNWWPTDEQSAPLWEFCQQLVNKRAFWLGERGNEQDCRQELIDKILTQLGFAWSDNLRMPRGCQDMEPDYLLYRSAEAKEAVLEKNIQARYNGSVSLLEAKKYGHPLSQISSHQQRYPHQQIRQYIDEAQVISWGILTNGKEWRLYCRDAKPSQFFAINFEVAIQSLENFKYFVALFSPQAFVRDNNKRCRLDAIRENAQAAQIELESDLRQRVFNLVEILANGFAERSENAIPKNPEGLRLLYENCLIFLYRLLFILYAEGRSLLPVEPHRKYYKDFSLARLVGPLKGFAEFNSPNRTRLYEDICELCRLINGTDKAKNREYSVPRYNGGLFDSSKHPELDLWRISDNKLADVLRGLMFAKPDRRERELPLETVDYADLRVQQLGSIYEGLLEHHFTHKDDGTLQLTTDKAERKATGTYYTPDYIVKYIVDNTVGPLLREIENSEPVKSAKSALRQDNSFADAVLALNILDPAMGSGHFLVEATTYLADQIVYHPTTKYQAEFIKGESQEHAEIAYWRRRVVEACIYGVDLNPLAVELAKLSLWLTTIASDQPLNFLDHHLRCGNSLIGARLDQLGKLPARKKKKAEDERQITFTFGPDLKKAVSAAIREIHNIESKASGDVDAVKDKESCWREKILPKLSPYKAIADLWTSAFFGNEMDEESYAATSKKILAGQSSGPKNDRCYFHWELEYPEVFFNEDGTPKQNPGFDAVIGNPPWGADLADVEQRYLVERFPVVPSKIKDSYFYFICQGIQILGESRSLGLIVPNTWLLINTAKDFRRYLLSLDLREIMEHGDGVFEQATVESATLILGNTGRTEGVCRAVRKRRGGTVVDHQVSTRVWLNDEFVRIIVDMDPAAHRLLSRLHGKSEPFSKNGVIIWGIKPYQVGYGIPPQTSEMVEKRVYHANTRRSMEWKPLLVGSDVNRYSLNFPGDLFVRYGEWLMYPSNEQLMLAPKILMRQTSDILRCCYDEGGYYCQNSVFLVHSSTLDLKYLLALFNSRLLGFVYECGNPQTGKVFAEVKPSVVKALPIHRIAFTTPDTERKRCAKKAEQMFERGLQNNDAGPVLAFVDEHMKASREDVIHDLLAFLAERMMAMNKEKQAATRGFLKDLKDFHGVDTHSLKPKTKLDAFWELETADLFAHLHANAKILASQDIRLKESDEEKIRDRFQKAKANIIPLESALSFTDRLIDQIVYRLYGLTEEEIKIVEGA